MNLDIDNNMISEMFIHVPMCTHYDPKNITILGSDEYSDKELQRYENITINRDLDKSEQDIILVNGKITSSEKLSELNSKLHENGILVAKVDDFVDSLDELSKTLQMSGTFFWINMIYKAQFKESQTFLFASKKYHPTADINLQRSDLLDDLVYYSSDMHRASFILPNAIDISLRGILKK